MSRAHAHPLKHPAVVKREPHPPYFMPSGAPCPSLMTEAEAITFLRLDNLAAPDQAMARFRSTGRLKGWKIGKCIRYTPHDLMEFVFNQEA